MNIDNVSAVQIQLDVEDHAVLSIRLTSSGSVNRMGDGTGDPENSRWYLGSTDEPLFDEWKSLLTPELMELSGRYEYPEPKGDKTKLTIIVDSDDESTGFEFLYGSESDGPPEEIFELVNAAVDVTEEWWTAQRSRKKR